MTFSAESRAAIGAAIEVHTHLGPGLLESAYQQALAHELSLSSVAFKKESPVDVVYKGHTLDCGYRADFVIADCLILELKCAERLEKIHQAQLLTYMKLSGMREGLLINFNVCRLKDGIQRLVL